VHVFWQEPAPSQAQACPGAQSDDEASAPVTDEHAMREETTKTRTEDQPMSLRMSAMQQAP
jgi:hypothetical protein